MKVKSQKYIFRTSICGILVLMWMTTVFIFSSQDGVQTRNTSSNFIHTIETTINKPNTEVSSYNEKTETGKTQTQKNYKYSEKVQKVVRKNAHFFLYMLGGVILSVFFCALYKLKYYLRQSIKKYEYKMIYFMPILIGFFYAITDEIHQRYVIGRTGKAMDVLIDTAGIITGTIIIFMIRYIQSKKKCLYSTKYEKLGE